MNVFSPASSSLLPERVSVQLSGQSMSLRLSIMLFTQLLLWLNLASGIYSLSSSLSPPLPKAAKQAVSACPSQFSQNNSLSCACHAFDDGLYLDCGGPLTAINLQQLLLSLAELSVGSLSLSQLNASDADYRLDRVFSQTPLQATQLQITGSALRELDEMSFSSLQDSVRTLSLSGGQLKLVKRNALRSLSNLNSLDLDSNELSDLAPYAFYAVPLQTLSVQSNRLCILHEHAFGGLESSLSALSLAHNCLSDFPHEALARLRRLRSLRLAGNQISSLQSPSLAGVFHTLLDDLEHLDLSENRIHTLASNAFLHTPKLTSLALSRNRLQSLPANVFSPLSSLDSLDLAANRLRSLGSHSFAGLGALRSLDLSNNHLHEIRANTLQILRSLHELFLTGNSLQRISNNTFASSERLAALFLSSNALTEIEVNAFHNLKSLRQLHLASNRLRSLSDALLQPCALSLRTLALDGNLITQLPVRLLSGHTQLHELRLQHNLLKHLPAGALDSCNNLQELHLQANRLEEIEPLALRRLRSLQYLDAASNRLQQLPYSMTSDDIGDQWSALRQLRLTGNQLYGLVNVSLSVQLEALWLDQNRLSELRGKPFEGLISLQKLHLQHNEIQTLDDHVFANLTSLVYLSLASNGLRELPATLFEGCNELMELELTGNHLLKLSANMFSPLSQLHTLHLQHNHLLSIEANALKGLSSLRFLNLEKSMLEQLPADAFSDLKNLKSLRLSQNPLKLTSLHLSSLQSLEDLELGSLNLTSNWIKNQLCTCHSLQQITLQSAQFSHSEIFEIIQCLPSVQKLVLNKLGLQDEHLPKLKDNFTLKSLNHVELEGNELTTLPNGFFSHFPQLKNLQMAVNRIRRILAFQLSSNVHLLTLNLSRNSISVLDVNCLANLSSLTTLDLSDNVIRFLPAGIFNGLIKLKKLYLQRNWMQFVPNSLLHSSLNELTLLHLSGNPLTKIREDLSVLGALNSLQELYLDKANLSVIASHDLLGFTHIRLLKLSANQIASISPGAFRDLSNLKTLEIDANQLRLVPTERLTGLKRLELLNLSGNALTEFPILHNDLENLKILDISHNRLSRLDSLGPLGESLIELKLTDNMLSLLDAKLFTNATQLSVLDLTQNHFTQFADGLFTPIEMSLTQLHLSDNPIHCDCGLLSVWEFLEEHSRLFEGQFGDLLCSQPELLTDVKVRSIQPADFCPAPKLTGVELAEAESDWLLLRWFVMNDSLVGGFSLLYQIQGSSWETPIQLPSTQRMHRLEKLESNTDYTICVQADGKYLRPLANLPTAYVLDRQRDHAHHLPTSNRRCIQARTLEYQKRTPIQLSTFGMIILAATMAGIFLLCSIVLILGIRYRRMRHESDSPSELKTHDFPEMPEMPELPELPEEFITYRHFSLPSTENIYS